MLDSLHKKSLLIGALVLVVIISAALLIRFGEATVEFVVTGKSFTDQTKPSPSPIPSPPSIALYPYNEQTQKWLIGLGGVLTKTNGESFETLESDLPRVAGLQYILGDLWSVNSREQALETLEWLKYQGQSQEFGVIRDQIVSETNGDIEAYQKLKKRELANCPYELQTCLSFSYDFAWEHRTDLATKRLMAWDYMRLINVARWSYTMGYITDREAWENMHFAGTELQKYYTSWEDVSYHYLLGRSFWNSSSYNPEAQNAVQWLKTNPESPWLKYAWDMELN